MASKLSPTSLFSVLVTKQFSNIFPDLNLYVICGRLANLFKMLKLKLSKQMLCGLNLKEKIFKVKVRLYTCKESKGFPIGHN